MNMPECVPIPVYKGPLLEYLRATVTETAANTYTEKEISTPAMPAVCAAMLIHSVEFDIQDSDLVTDARTLVNVGLQSESLSTVPVLSDPEAIALASTITEDDSTAGSTVGKSENKKYQTAYMARPVAYGRSNMYLSITGAVNAGAKTSRVRVGYTLEIINSRAFVNSVVKNI